MTKTLLRQAALLLFSALIVACSGLIASQEPALPATETNAPLSGTAAPATLPTGTPEPESVTTTPLAPAGIITLRVWLPPQFDPALDSPASELLRARLDEFTQAHPGVEVEVRVKASDGPGGLLDALSTANAAAPLALPDLIAMPRPMLETAALKGLLHPLDELSTAVADPDWYEYARQLARVQNSAFGLPFAGDALLMLYPTTMTTTIPMDWGSPLTSTLQLTFPAADPQALFTLALYQSAGGSVQDSQGRPALDIVPLSQALTFIANGASSGLFPNWLTLYETDAQSWEPYQTGQAQLAITWVSRWLQSSSDDDSITYLPTADGAAFSLATGWVWALSSSDPGHQLLAVQLAEFLTTPEFLAEWTYAAGYLPPRPSSLDAWPQTSQTAALSELASAARLIPSSDLLAALSQPLKQATIEVLKQQTGPVEAAQKAAEELTK